MAGLGAALAAAPPAAAPVAAAPPAGQAQMAEGTPATPEEQEVYDNFVSMALLHIHDPSVAPDIAQRIHDGDPVEEIARIGATVAMTVMQKAEEAGDAIPPEVILHGGAQIIDALVEIGEATGIDIDDEAAEMAFYRAADEFREMNPDIAQSLAAELDEPTAQTARDRLAQLGGR